MPRSARDKVSIDDDVVERRGVDGPSIHDIGKDDLVADDLAPGQVFGSRCQQPQSMAQGALDDTWIPHRLREEFYGWRGAGHLRTDRHPSGGLEVTKSNARVTGGHDDCGIVVEVHRLEIDRDIQQLQPLPRLFEVHFQLVDGTDECQLLLSPEIGHELDLGSPIRKALTIRVDLAGNEHVLNEDSDLPTLKASLADHRLSVPGSRSRFEDWMPVSRFLDKWSVNPTAVAPAVASNRQREESRGRLRALLDLLNDRFHELLGDLGMPGRDEVSIDHDLLDLFFSLVVHDLTASVLDIADDVVGASDLAALDERWVRAEEPKGMADRADLQPLGSQCRAQEVDGRGLVGLPLRHMLLVAQSVHRIGADEEDGFVIARFDGVHLDGHLDLILDHAILGVGPIDDGGVAPEMGDVFDFVTLLWEVLVEHLELGRIVMVLDEDPDLSLSSRTGDHEELLE